MRRYLSLIASAVLISLSGPALAQHYPGGWGGHGRAWDDQGGRVGTQGDAEPSRKIDVETFRAADAGDRLGKGRIVVTDDAALPPPPAAIPAAVPGDNSRLPGNDDDAAPAVKLPVYEAAVIDQLGAKGYDIANASDPAQVIEIAVTRDVVIPQEAAHRPVSGEMSVGVGNRGVSYGMAIAVDLSKPKKAITATRMDVRIRDRATHRVLWEGHAQGQARMTDAGNDDTRMATRLAVALFARFPDGTVVAPMAGADSLTPHE